MRKTKFERLPRHYSLPKNHVWIVINLTRRFGNFIELYKTERKAFYGFEEKAKEAKSLVKRNNKNFRPVYNKDIYKFKRVHTYSFYVIRNKNIIQWCYFGWRKIN